MVYTPFPRDALILAVLYIDRLTRLSTSSVPLIPSLHPSSRPSSPLPPQLLHEGEDDSIPLAEVENPIMPLLNSFTLHRLLLATLLCSAKFSSDGGISQSRVAKVGGVELRELVRLEVEVIKCLQWSLWWEVADVEGVSEALMKVGEGMGVVGSQDEVEVGEEAVEKLGACLKRSISLIPVQSPSTTQQDDGTGGDPEEEEEDEEEEEPEWRKALNAASKVYHSSSSIVPELKGKKGGGEVNTVGVC